jgi:hypothetical protein
MCRSLCVMLPISVVEFEVLLLPSLAENDAREIGVRGLVADCVASGESDDACLFLRGGLLLALLDGYSLGVRESRRMRGAPDRRVHLSMSW